MPDIIDTYTKAGVGPVDAAVPVLPPSYTADDLLRLYTKTGAGTAQDETSDADLPMVGNRRVTRAEISPRKGAPPKAPAAPSMWDYIIDKNRLPSGKDVAELGAAARNVLPNIGAGIVSNVKGAAELTGSGIQDWKEGNYLPSFPSWDPKTWSAGGPLKAIGGGAAMVGAIPTALLDELVAKPVTEVTGNPEIGSRAALATGMRFPLARAAERAPSNRAFEQLAKTIAPEDIPALAQRLQANPRLTFADVSKPVQAQTQGLATDVANPGAVSVLEKATKERTKSAVGAVGQYYNDLTGEVPDVMALLDKFKANARAVGDKQIMPALSGAQPVDITPVINLLDKKIRPPAALGRSPPTPLETELQAVRDKITGGQPVATPGATTLFNPNTMHSIQADLRAQADDMLHSATGSDRTIGKAMMDVRQAMVDAIDKAAGGKYAPALQAYRDEKDVERAYQRGRGIFRQGGDEERPEFWRNWAKDATDAELQAARLGSNVARDQEIARVRNPATRGQALLDPQFVRSRFDILHGKDSTDELAQLLRDERDIAETNQFWFKGSQTARATAAQKAMQPREMVPLATSMQALLPPAIAEIGTTAAGLPGAGAGMAAALGFGRKAWQAMGRRSDINRNTAYAKLASSTGTQRDAALNALYARAFPQATSQSQKLLDFLRLRLPAH